MRRISEQRLKELEREIRKEFPESYSLQQVHLARLVIEEKTKGMTQKQLIGFFKRRARQLKSRAGSRGSRGT